MFEKRPASEPAGASQGQPDGLQGSALAYSFGKARFDERSLELTVAGALVKLERKPLECLRCLLRRAGEMVTHDELLDAVWPGRILSDSVLKKCISSLRDALQDDNQDMVKTVHGYGYRLGAPVQIEHLKPSILRSPSFSAEASPELRHGAALIVDIAATVELRQHYGSAAASRRIRKLLDSIVLEAEASHGAFIKSYGDDVLAVFEKDPINSAASVAIAAQRAAAQAGMQLYAGLHAGEIEFRHYMGHPDAAGQAINIAARLHKLTEGAPGRIFMAEDSVAALAPLLRARATLFGPRELRGLGTMSVWTLDWHEMLTTAETLYAEDTGDGGPCPGLLLRHGQGSVQLGGANRSGFIGRGKDCALRVPDPEPRISLKHLLIEQSAGRWLAEDISRNGTWLRDGGNGEETLLPYCNKVMLPRAGALCLGRAFADDADGRFTVNFELAG